MTGSGAPQLAVGAVLVLDHELLMIRRKTEPSKGLWSLPGGRVERGEVMAEAVVREVREECGLGVFCGPAIDWVERISEDFHFVIVNFAVTLDGQPDPEAGTDALEAAWISTDDVSQLPLVPGLIEFLAEHQIVDTLT